MSLIIDMLKDLETRQHNNASIPPMETSHQRYTLNDRSMNKKILFIAAVTAMLLCAYLFAIFGKSSYLNIPIPSEVPLNKSKDISNMQTEELLTPVTINSVSFEAKNNDTEVMLELSHKSIYRVGTDSSGNIIISLNNASMKSDMPTLVGADIGIQRMTSSNIDGVLKFTISLKSGAYLQSVDTSSIDNKSRLVISISNSTVNAPEQIAASSVNIKTPAMQTILIEKYHEALRTADAGNKPEAMDSLKKLLQYYPDYQDVRVSLAAMVLESGNPVKARAIIDDGLSITPDYLPLIELKARLLTSEGKIEEAIMVLQSEQPPITEAPSYHALIAALYNRTNNSKIAIGIYQKLVQINPHEGSWWFGLGVSQDKLGQNTDAMYAYTKAATEGRLNAQAMTFLHSRLKALQEERHAQK